LAVRIKRDRADLGHRLKSVLLGGAEGKEVLGAFDGFL